MEAARYGHADVVSLLIDHGVNVKQENSDGRTALLEAAGSGYSDYFDFFMLFV